MCDFTGPTGFIEGAAAAANRSVSQSVVDCERASKGEGGAAQREGESWLHGVPYVLTKAALAGTGRFIYHHDSRYISPLPSIAETRISSCPSGCVSPLSRMQP